MARLLIIALFSFVAIKSLVAPGRSSVYPEYSQAGLDFWSAEPLSFVAQQYLPYFSLAMSPLALLPDRVGQTLWAVGTLALYLTGLRAFFLACVLPSLRADSDLPAHRGSGDPGASAPGVTRRSWLVFLLCGVCVGMSSLANQQANALIAGLLLWGSVFVRRGRWWPAAACLALPMFKVYPLALGLVFCVLRPGLAWRMGLIAACLLAVPLLALPLGDAADRYLWIVEYMREGVHSLRFHLVGVREWLGQLGVEPSPAEFLPIQALAGGIIALLALASREGDEGRERRGFVLTCLWFVTFGPSVEGPTYLLAAPALGWLLLRSWRRGAWTAFGFTLGLILLCGPAQTSLFGVEAQRWMARTRPACLALLMAFAWQVGAALTRVIPSARTQDGSFRPCRSAATAP